MAGPLDIQRPATGLIDILGLRTQANSPPLMSEQVSGTLDLLDLYTLSRRTSTMSILASTITAAGFVSFGSLPQVSIAPGTAWLLYSAFSPFSIPVGVFWSGSLVVRRNAYNSLRGYTFIDGAERHMGSASVIDYKALGRYFEKPLLLLPGDELGILTNNVTGTVNQNAGHFDYAVLSI